MSRDVEVRCRCAEVQGRLRAVSRRTTNRVICYCDDCQAFAHWLDRADLLDAHGGTDIVQVAPASLSFDRGTDRVAGIRLSSKGLYRFYATCCKTPLGNMTKPSVPFIGLGHEFLQGDPTRPNDIDGVFGPPRAAILGKYAIGKNPGSPTLTTARMIAHAARCIVGWKVTGKTWPHPFLDRATNEPRSSCTTLVPGERDALRPKCGPRPMA